MPLAEAAALAIATRVLQEAASAGVRWAGGKRADQRRQRALAGILTEAMARFDERHSQWSAALVDASFFEQEAAPLIAQLFLAGGEVSPTALAEAWADSVALRDPERRRTRVRELEGPVASLLEDISTHLRASAEFQELVNDRVVHILSRDVKRLIEAAEAERATPGTLRDFLRWVQNRYSHIDPRGIPQTERQVLVPLDQVYVGLSARDEQSADRAPQAELRTPRSPAHEAGDVPLPAALAGPAVVFLGDPGSGKTTLLRYLALMFARALDQGAVEVESGLGTPRLPILIRIADYAEDGLSRPLSQYLIEWHRAAEAPAGGLADLFDDALDRGEAVVLLDGLDEIVDADARQRVVQRIDDFVKRFGPAGNRFVVTSRVAGYREMPLGGAFATFRVRPMDDAQIAQFLNRWCHAVERQAANGSDEDARRRAEQEIAAITAAIRASPGVRRLATNPLLLTILTLIHRTGAALPQRRIALYNLAVETLARTWRRAQGVPEAALVDETLLTRVLSHVAYWLHTERPSGVATLAELKPVVQQRWAEVQGLDWDPDDPPYRVVEQVEQFMTAVRVQTGLLIERSPDRYGFMHLTFEEYYVARNLVARHRTAADRIRQHLHDPRWEEPIRLALGFVGLGSADDAAALVDAAVLARGEEAEKFEPSADEALLGRDLRFALRCLADLVPMNPVTTREMLEVAYRDVSAFAGRGRIDVYVRSLIKAVGELPLRDRRVVTDQLVADLRAGREIPRERATAIASIGFTDDEWRSAVLRDWRFFGPLIGSDSLYSRLAAGDRAAFAAIEAGLSAYPEGTAGMDAMMLAEFASDDYSLTAVAEVLRRELKRDPRASLEQLFTRDPPLAAAIAGDVLEAYSRISSEQSSDATIGGHDEIEWGTKAVLGVARLASAEVQAMLERLAHNGSVEQMLLAAQSFVHAADGADADNLSAVEACLRALAQEPTEPLAALFTLKEALTGETFTDAVARTVDAYIDDAREHVRVAALDVLISGPVTDSTIRRVLAGGLSDSGQRPLLSIEPADQDQYVGAFCSYVEADEASAESAAIRVLAQYAAASRDAVNLLRRQLARSNEAVVAAAAVGLIRAGDEGDRAAVAARFPELSPETQRSILLEGSRVATTEADLRSVLDAADETVSRNFSVLIRARLQLEVAPEEVILFGLEAGEGWREVACQVAGRGRETDAIARSLIAVVQKEDDDARSIWRSVIDNLAAMGRRSGGTSSMSYRLLREELVRSLDQQPPGYDFKQDLLFSALVAAAAPAEPPRESRPQA